MRVGLVRRTRFGTTCEEAVASLFTDLPVSVWDLNPAQSAGRLANHLRLHAAHFVTLALQNVAPRIYRRFHTTKKTADLRLPLAT